MSDELIEQLREILTEPAVSGEWFGLVGYLREFAADPRLNIEPETAEEVARIQPILDRLYDVLGKTAL